MEHDKTFWVTSYNNCYKCFVMVHEQQNAIFLINLQAHTSQDIDFHLPSPFLNCIVIHIRLLPSSMAEITCLGNLKNRLQK